MILTQLQTIQEYQTQVNNLNESIEGIRQQHQVELNQKDEQLIKNQKEYNENLQEAKKEIEMSLTKCFEEKEQEIEKIKERFEKVQFS